MYKLRNWIDESKLKDGLNENIRAVKYLEDHPQKINWSILSGNAEAIYLLQENRDKINWTKLSENNEAIHILEENEDKIDWDYLSFNQSSIPLLRKNMLKVNWMYMAVNLKGIGLMEDNLDKIHWDILCANRSAMPLINRFKDKIDWQILSGNPASIELLKENVDPKPHYGHTFEFTEDINFIYDAGLVYIKSGNKYISIDTRNMDEYDSENEEHCENDNGESITKTIAGDLDDDLIEECDPPGYEQPEFYADDQLFEPKPISPKSFFKKR